jgi:endonuclease YncB( thermonuclease family)
MDSSGATVTGDNRSSTTSFTFARTRETGETSATTYLYSPQASVETTFTTNAASLSATDSDWFIGGGSMTVTTAYDGLTLFVGAGNFTGTIRVYGVSNS